MTIWSRRRVIGLLAFGPPMLACPVASWAQQRSPLAERMAKAYGLDSFAKIDGIRFTFNVERPGLQLARAWQWDPKTDTVSFKGKDKEGKPITAVYRRSQLASQSDLIRNTIDPAFINDQYWLLLPFHAVWDGSATVTGEGVHKLPLGNGSAEELVMKYPSQGGYAPGDVWELYLGPDNRIEVMVYRRGSAKEPRVITATWTGYKKAGPLLVATEHHVVAGGKPARIFFSDVAVKLAGSDSWVNAQ